jgi:hypothetical protein
MRRMMTITMNSKRAKEPMSPELYLSICKWLLEWSNLEWSNLDGVFAVLFIMLSWNLVCHGNKNTAKI